MFYVIAWAYQLITAALIVVFFNNFLYLRQTIPCIMSTQTFDAAPSSGW